MIINNNSKFDICIICGKETEYEWGTPVFDRVGYFEGTGQLCRECLSRIYIKNHSCSDQYDPDAMLSNDIGVVRQAESVSADIDFYAHSAAKM